MIPVQEVVDLMKFELDSEGSERYLFDLDFKPAINLSIKWLVFVFNRAFEENKFSGENLRDLIRTRIWVANNFSRIKFDPLFTGDELWSYLAVHPEPTVYPTGSLPPALANDYTSEFQPDIAYVKSRYSANKLTVEKWNESSDNVFEPGNSLVGGSLKSYAYLTEVDYSTATTYTQDKEIEIRPDVSGQFVAMTYLKNPSNINLISDNIEFPSSLTALFVQKALNFISIKQGDQTTLFSITENDVARLIKTIS
jgi:hypothetical protein